MRRVDVWEGVVVGDEVGLVVGEEGYWVYRGGESSFGFVFFGDSYYCCYCCFNTLLFVGSFCYLLGIDVVL